MSLKVSVLIKLTRGCSRGQLRQRDAWLVCFHRFEFHVFKEHSAAADLAVFLADPLF